MVAINRTRKEEARFAGFKDFSDSQRLVNAFTEPVYTPRAPLVKFFLDLGLLGPFCIETNKGGFLKLHSVTQPKSMRGPRVMVPLSGGRGGILPHRPTGSGFLAGRSKPQDFRVPPSIAAPWLN
jgi:hypothetical protein